MLKGFRLELSPRSGRTKIAQRFIAGNQQRARSKSAKRTAEMLAAIFCRRFTGFGSILSLNPALECWAIIGRPLRGLPSANEL